MPFDLPLLPMRPEALAVFGDDAADVDFDAYADCTRAYLRSTERDSLIFVRWLADNHSDDDLTARGWDAAEIRAAVARYPALSAA